MSVGIGINGGYSKGGGGASLEVTDGVTTVSDVTEVNFTSNATVSSGGAGIADVAISGGAGANGLYRDPNTANGFATATYGNGPYPAPAHTPKGYVQVFSDGVLESDANIATPPSAGVGVTFGVGWNPAFVTYVSYVYTW